MEKTRYVRLHEDFDRDGALNEGTCVARSGPLVAHLRPSPEFLFNRHHQELFVTASRFTRPGFAVFALHQELGVAGHLWLEATDELRASGIGRHSCVDLFLPEDRNLSLRHLLLLVRGGPEGLRLRVMDLATPNGFYLESGESLRAAEADGFLVFGAASYVFVAIRTGAALPWALNSPEPWRSLPKRVVLARQERLAGAALPHGVEKEDTSVTLPRGPVEVGSESLVGPGEAPRGRLHLVAGDHAEILGIGQAALDRGVLIGSYHRCAGTRRDPDRSLSRVHAVLITIEDVLHLADVGSRNGTFLNDVELRCAPVDPGATYQLGQVQLRWAEVQ